MEQWSLASVGLLRHAGFPFEMIRALEYPEVAAEADQLLCSVGQLQKRAHELKQLFREKRIGRHGDAATPLGILTPFKNDTLQLLDRELDPSDFAKVEEYQNSASEVDARWSAYARRLDSRVEESRATVFDLFQDPSLRQVLLISNDARYTEFAAWLDDWRASSAGHRRRMADLLVMYLQRITTKNETNSHFGPLSVIRMDRDGQGADWTEGALRRRTFWSHWAGEALATTFGSRPRLRELARPRRSPLAFLEGDRIQLYAFRTETGGAGDWRFTEVSGGPVSKEQRRLWEALDGSTTVARLRTIWSAQDDSTASFDETLQYLVDRGWAIAGWEIPVGVADPLTALSELLDEAGPGAADELRHVAALKNLLAEFADASHPERVRLYEELRRNFSRTTALSPHRSSGRHYADRSVLYEEAHSPVTELRLGSDLVRTVETELAPAFELALLPSRLRHRRETEILRAWFVAAFGSGIPVTLPDFYRRFFEDEAQFAEQCDLVDQEIRALDQRVTDALLGGVAAGGPTVDVSGESLRRIIDDTDASSVPVVCNPDVMLAAADAEALASGDFLAVIGECHAVRELLTHSSFAALLQDRAPDLLEEVHQGYRSVLDTDEILVDLSRAHLDKTSAALVFPVPDLEVHGRSPKHRDQVIQPSELYLVERAGRLELRAQGCADRIRLMAPLAGGPSIRQDPLLSFAFPRHFGGISLRGSAHRHLPRITCGRVVLQRELWRIPAQSFKGWSPGLNAAKGDAAEFLTARRLRDDLGLPRFGFAKIPGEPKPVFVDWESPLLTRQLFRLARGATAPVEFSEMLPGPDQLWLRIDGARHTSELRCAVFSRGADRADGGSR